MDLQSILNQLKKKVSEFGSSIPQNVNRTLAQSGGAINQRTNSLNTLGGTTQPIFGLNTNPGRTQLGAPNATMYTPPQIPAFKLPVINQTGPQLAASAAEGKIGPNIPSFNFNPGQIVGQTLANTFLPGSGALVPKVGPNVPTPKVNPVQVASGLVGLGTTQQQQSASKFRQIQSTPRNKLSPQQIAFAQKYADENLVNSGLGFAGSMGIKSKLDFKSATNLTEAERSLENKFGSELSNNLQGAIGKYKQMFGKVINTDNARELSNEYSKNKTLSAAVHEPASALAKKIYEQELKIPDPKGNNRVVFTAGGTGSGKTTAVNGNLQALMDESQIVYDTNLSNFSSAKQKIEQALQAGKKVSIAYVDRNPLSSLESAVGRAVRSGRTVPLQEHINTHIGAPKTIVALADHYKDNPNVDINVINNNGLKGQSVLSSVDSLRDINYNRGELERVLNEKLNELQKTGKAPGQIIEAFRGSQNLVQKNGQINGGGIKSSISQGLTPQNVSETKFPVVNQTINDANTTTSGIGNRTGDVPVAPTSTTPQIAAPEANIVSQTKTSTPIVTPKNATPEEVAATLPARIDSFTQKVLGYSTADPTGGTKGANAYTSALRKGQESITTKVEQGLSSENKLVRNAASGLQNFFRGLGMSPERANASMELRGGIANANDQAYNIMDSLYKSLGNNKTSLEKINAVLDPSIAKNKVSFNDLTPIEKQVYGIIREGLNLVHDTSYANGHISPDLYSSNKNKYVPRLYDVTELPAEVSKFVTQGKKLANDLYKNRTDINDWKIENSLNDPVYGLGKRLAQVQTNTAIKSYTDFLASKPNLVSDVERAGFTKLSDSKAYGALSGKYVLNSAAEDLKGFFFSNQATQNLYDVFRAYDRMGIRQLQKKMLTVFNPTTNVGNIVSDQVFGFVTGVDPLTLNKNLLYFKNNPAEYKQLSNYLVKRGVLGTDITRTDFVNKMGQINSLTADVANPSRLKGLSAKIVKAGDKIQSFYGGTDDVYKASAFKGLLDKGFSLEEATRKVADGFQNYANVGKFYDVWAKTPVVGSTFIKFQGDLIRIIKNGAVNNPLGLIGFLGALWGVARLSSKLSGESDQNRITRENRFAAPMIPGLNIPLTWQTPMGEINAARYISPFYANNDTTNVAKMFPFVPNIDPKKDVASNIAMNANDPLLSTPVQLAVNRDFRGKPISDPNENKYQPSTLTPQEKLTNQAAFVSRAYTPPPINSAIDVASAAQGKPNMYGATQTVPQAAARLAGIKISQFGPQQADEQRQKDSQFQQQGNDFIDKQISAVTKQQLSGSITPEQAKNRIDSLNSQKVTVPLVGNTQSLNASPVTSVKSNNSKIVQQGNQFAYLDKNGDLTKTDTRREAEIGLAKVSFQNSSSNFKDLGDVVLRKSTNGTVTTETKDQYNSSLYDAKMTSDKRNEDFKSWLDTADKQFTVLNNQLNDPQTDELDKITIQNKIDTLVSNYQKYKSYGGFTKGKKSPKITLKAAPKIKVTMPKFGGTLKAPKLTPFKAKQVSNSTGTINTKIKLPKPIKIKLKKK